MRFLINLVSTVIHFLTQRFFFFIILPVSSLDCFYDKVYVAIFFPNIFSISVLSWKNCFDFLIIFKHMNGLISSFLCYIKSNKRRIKIKLTGFHQKVLELDCLPHAFISRREKTPVEKMSQISPRIWQSSWIIYWLNFFG